MVDKPTKLLLKLKVSQKTNIKGIVKREGFLIID